MLVPHALPAGGPARLGATRGFATGLLGGAINIIDIIIRDSCGYLKRGPRSVNSLAGSRLADARAAGVIAARGGPPGSVPAVPPTNSPGPRAAVA